VNLIASSDPNMSTAGAVSKAFLDAAGPQLQAVTHLNEIFISLGHCQPLDLVLYVVETARSVSWVSLVLWGSVVWVFFCVRHIWFIVFWLSTTAKQSNRTLV